MSLKIGPGADAPKKVIAFIEIPKGGNVKYEYDEKNEVVKVDRILHTSMVFPYNYGFIPGTMGEDGDPLDICVLSTASFAVGTTVAVRPVGAVLMEDEEGVDTKIVAVPVDKIDPEYIGVKDTGDLTDHTKGMIVHFLTYYKSIEPGKWIKMKGWGTVDQAYDLINKAISKGKKTR